MGENVPAHQTWTGTKVAHHLRDHYENKRWLAMAMIAGQVDDEMYKSFPNQTRLYNRRVMLLVKSLVDSVCYGPFAVYLMKRGMYQMPKHMGDR